MGGKTNFYISDNTYLHHANYNLALESGAMVSAFLGKILIGLSDYDDKGQLRFNPKRTIIIPASNFVEFIKVIKKAYNALKNKSEEKFKDLIYQHNPTHLLVGKFQSWENEWGFSMFYKWRHTMDKNWQNLVLLKERDPVNISQLKDPEYQPLKRGVYNLRLADLEMMVSQLDTILRYTSSYESDEVKRNVSNFVDYAVNDCRTYLLENLKNYEEMRLPEKIKIMHIILKGMFEKNGKPDDNFGIKFYLDILSNKTDLIFALFHD